MKHLAILIVSSVLVWQFAVAAARPSCESSCPVYIQAPPPVCGDGKEYMDECRAKCAGAKEITPGPCPDCESTCPVYIQAPPPVCGDGKEYMDECRAKCDGAKKITPGPCPVLKPCICTMEYNPVCCGGKVYSNMCFARCYCPKSYSPGPCLKGR